MNTEPTGFHSRDCEIVYSDGPGDTTVRPPRPLLLKLGLAERERLARLRAALDQPPPSDKPPDLPDPNRQSP
jgi:hypothetical protein